MVSLTISVTFPKSSGMIVSPLAHSAIAMYRNTAKRLTLSAVAMRNKSATSVLPTSMERRTDKNLLIK